MQLRVVTDQPWDVPADVLVIPIVGEPAFDGPARRAEPATGGELAALPRSASCAPSASPRPLAAPGENRARRRPDDQRRAPRRSSTARRSSTSAPPRSTGSAGVMPPRSRSGSTRSRPASRARGRRRARRPRRRRGQLRPEDASIATATTVATAPPDPRRADPRRARRATRPSIQKAAERGVIIGEGANHAQVPLEPGGERRQPRGPRRGGPRARRASTASGSTSSSRIVPASSAWGCSSPSARAATTRRG